jgi:hypothetical protein
MTRRITPALCAARRARGILATLHPGEIVLIPLDGGRYWQREGGARIGAVAAQVLGVGRYTVDTVSTEGFAKVTYRAS